MACITYTLFRIRLLSATCLYSLCNAATVRKAFDTGYLRCWLCSTALLAHHVVIDLAGVADSEKNESEAREEAQ